MDGRIAERQLERASCLLLLLTFSLDTTEPLSAENIFTYTKAFWKSVCVSVSVELNYCIFPSLIGQV